MNIRGLCSSVTLMAVGSPASEELLHELVQAVFRAMVLSVGLEELKTIRSVERLKRDLRVNPSEWATCKKRLLITD